MGLTEKKCIPCEGGTLPLGASEVRGYLSQLQTEWEVLEDKNPEPEQVRYGARIRKEFKFKDFLGAIAFVNQVAEIAEQENHHPDIHIFYRKVIIELWTHDIGGLSENDFILAAKIENRVYGII